MGLIITPQNIVIVEESHNRLLNIGLERNPNNDLIEPDFPVFSIFTRTKKSKKDQSSIGDNCALLYALKNKQGLKTTYTSIKILYNSFEQIIKKEQTTYDLIIPMPSSYSISTIVATRLMRHFNCALEKNIFEKITVEEAQQQISSSQQIEFSERKIIEFRLKRMGNIFSLKDIPVKYRNFINPLKIKTPIKGSHTKILLVDDLLSTGTTLKSARTLIKTTHPAIKIEAACLFSKI